MQRLVAKIQTSNQQLSLAVIVKVTAVGCHLNKVAIASSNLSGAKGLVK